MFGKNPQPVDLLIVAHTKVNDQVVEAGTILPKCEPELALELAGAGKARAATAADIEAAKAAKAAKTTE